MDSPHLEQAKRLLGQLRPGSHFVSAETLGGGMSNEMTLVQWGTAKFIVRVPGEYIRTHYPDPVDAEQKTLSAVRSAGIPAPEPLGRGEDFLLLSYLEGTPTARPSDPEQFIANMAQQLARIHKIPTNTPALHHLLPTKPHSTTTKEPNQDLREHEIIAAITPLEPIPLTPQVLRHGDFWPGNVLWQDGEISGVLDWENALLGPAIADLAISRLDIAWILGFDAMEEFTKRYLEANPINSKHLAYWDLRISRRSMGNLAEWVAPYQSLDRPDITLESMRETLLEFIDQALTNL